MKLRDFDVPDVLVGVAAIGLSALTFGGFAFIGWHVLKALAMLEGCP